MSSHVFERELLIELFEDFSLRNGRFVSPVSGDLQGMPVKLADAAICSLLHKMGRLVLKESHEHSYPFCWRSDTPLIYKAVPSWFVAVETIRENLIQNNKQTYWVPASVRTVRVHKALGHLP